jgi:lipopolysaccharide assembly outer membrane protein LptD (OstA)
MPIPMLAAIAMATLFGNFNQAEPTPHLPLNLSPTAILAQTCENCIILDRTAEKQASVTYKGIKVEADHIRINVHTNKGVAWGNAKMQVEEKEMMISAEKVEF